MLFGSTENSQFLTMGLYVEYVSSQASTAWSRLCRGDPLRTVLEQCFFVRGLPNVQICRLLGYLNVEWFDASTSSFVGERARWQLADMLGLPRDDMSIDLEHYLELLALEVDSGLRTYAVSLLGEAAAGCLLDSLPPAVSSLLHWQLHEHMLCETFKVLHPDNRHDEYDASCGLSNSRYRELLRKCFEVTGPSHPELAILPKRRKRR